ncbi:gamma-glutamylcyclotransferase family protein [Rhodovulum sp. ES.010]|uniref:gamma-glutamylcyclotransferase family protein n=1 Tax=Rhodovulum sp. ES.010 TaxID=1882821 RepID=UPI000940DF80|nr:gamma-glutamylcyclotransferase family protein [Rhodovulum sp. ES.010]
MHDPYFFGYGSLVNRATHDYPRATRARLTGWRRAWTHTTLRDVAYLSAVPAEGGVIDGLIASVPGHDWAALDERERAYNRHAVSHTVEHEAGHPVYVQVYSVPGTHAAAPTIRHPILLSYIDVVVQGYLREFGKDGARRFFETTDGWDAPILNDRTRPIYQRHQMLTGDEYAFVDQELTGRDATIVERA